MNIHSIIKNRSVYVHNNYFSPLMFEVLKRKMRKFNYFPTCLPEGFKWYGNRFQGYPCYDCYDLSINMVGTPKGQRLRNYLKRKLEKDFDLKIKRFWVTMRYTKTDELKQSASTLEGCSLIHADAVIKDTCEMAGVFYFDQSYFAGTAFFRTLTCKIPDIKITSEPNRLILYNVESFHAAYHDFTFDQRNVMVFNFEYE